MQSSMLSSADGRTEVAAWLGTRKRHRRVFRWNIARTKNLIASEVR